jgi:tetratricopeptide (TPR) repeat protein
MVPAERDGDAARERLMLRAYKAIALGGAGMAQEALVEIDVLGDLDAIDAPFVLRYAKVHLTAIARTSRSVEGLHGLLAWCSRGAAAAVSADDRALWESRECYCLSAIAARHLQASEYALTIAALEQVVERRPTDPAVLSDLGRAYLLVGGIAQAAAFFREADKHVGDPAKSALSLVNAAFLRLANEQYSPAIEMFNAARGQDGRTSLANNMAVGWVFNGNLTRALATFHEAAGKDPASIDDALMGNLCVMYDLTSDVADKKKAELLAFIKRNSGNDPPQSPISKAMRS